MSRALRIVLTTIKWIVVAAGAALLVVVLVNLRDEDLTPEARALAEPERPSVPDAQNAYLLLAGFDTPVGSDPVAAGARLVSENNLAAEKNPWGPVYAARDTSADSARSGGRPRFAGQLEKLCEPFKGPCLAHALAGTDDIRSMTAANAELISRYLAMQQLPAYANTAIPTAAQPQLSGEWGSTRRLLLTQAALQAQTGEPKRAIAFLADDIGFWRRVLAGGGNLVDEMIAVRMLASDFRILSELLASPSFDPRPFSAQLRPMLAPLTSAESNSAHVFKKEFEMQARLHSALAKDLGFSGQASWSDRLTSGLWFSLFSHPNASLNYSARLFSGVQAAASHSPAEFIERRDRLQRESDELSQPSVSWLYNPAGKMLVGTGMPSYPEFAGRVFDLAAYVQLVRAQLELRLAAVPAGDVPAFLAAAGAETRNPYNGRPFVWNGADRALSFEPSTKRWREWDPKAVVPPPAATH
jgi:hypothetical protein